MGSVGDIFPLSQQEPSTTPFALNGSSHEIEELTTPILIIGGGPVGMLLAYMLSHRYNQSCTLIEQATTTSIQPKMEFTNGRTMEIYKALGLADELRNLGVPEKYTLNEIISAGLGDGCEPICVWERASPEEIRKQSREQNDGSWPREPYLRCSQIPVEKWLKGLVQSKSETGVKTMFGWKFLGLREEANGVVSEVINDEGQKLRFRSQYVVGCDGGGSLVRKQIGVQSERKSLNMNFIFIHVRSRDPRMRSQGRFWHLNGLGGALCVSQDEIDTYTWHFIVPDGTELATFDAEKAIYEGVGGLLGPCKLEIDEIILKGAWKCGVAVANNFRSDMGRVFLAGDSAHQLSPVGGHGLNSGIGDIHGLSWKIAAVLQGWGSEALLDSHDAERRPCSQNNAAMVEKGLADVLVPLATTRHKYTAEEMLAKTNEGEMVRKEISEMMQKGYWIHHQDGTTLGYRYAGSPVVVHNESEVEPVFEVDKYEPTTWPGGRPPHVWLRDGVTSILDLLRSGFSVVDFTPAGEVGERFVKIAQEIKMPLEMVHLPTEEHARSLWERDIVLVRPDGLVGWRLPSRGQAPTEDDVRRILSTVSGKTR